ncbi:hypothetical protein CDAR_180081 [Caerostris darwini]|uniref:Uncharacterized protein n=1 Tax=Caerostris darwini TaxID=1538125 RepID=A0AAV4TWQ0_9ARAC|nr:hypothetical protein CDAR_180081 [Caerostris darwini]
MNLGTPVQILGSKYQFTNPLPLDPFFQHSCQRIPSCITPPCFPLMNAEIPSALKLHSFSLLPTNALLKASQREGTNGEKNSTSLNRFVTPFPREQSSQNFARNKSTKSNSPLFGAELETCLKFGIRSVSFSVVR